MDWSERDLKSIWHPYTQAKTAPAPIPIVRAEGAYLYDDQNRKYFDGISSWWVNLHGHSHPKIAERIAKQAARLEHVMFAGFTHAPAIELSEKLLEILPYNQKRVFFSDNGSTAVEVALKLALQFWANRGEKKRKRIVSFEGAYHGDTFGAMSVSDKSPFTAPFEDFLFPVTRIPFPGPGSERDSLLALESILAEGDCAALIVEPLVQGAGGFRICSPEAMKALYLAAKKSHALVIADEVMTGFFRTGKAFASDHFEPNPDLICLSKGITGGALALGATTCTSELFDAFLSDDRSKTFFHGHSFTANPIACSAALASLELLKSQDCLDRIARISSQQYVEIRSLESVQNPRSLGTVAAFDLPGQGYLDPLGPRLASYFLSQGLLLRPLGNTVYVLPPYCTEPQELRWIYDVIREGLKQIKA